MSHYRKVDVRIWNDEGFRSLSDDGKLVFFFSLTHPNLTALGAMRATPAGLAAELGWSERRLRGGLGESVTRGMVELNTPACYLALPKFLRYNEPEGPNSVTKAWLKALDTIPECPEKRALILRCRKYLDGRSQEFKDRLSVHVWEAFSDAMPETISGASSIQEQELEQEQHTPPPGSSAGRRSPPSHPRSGAAVDVTGFPEFWSAYPRHDARRAAEKAWARLRPSPEMRDTIMAAMASQQRAGGTLNPGSGAKFIPYPASWLNDRRWEDLPAASAGNVPPQYEPPLNWRCKDCGDYHLTPKAQKGQCPKAANSKTPEASG